MWFATGMLTVLISMNPRAAALTDSVVIDKKFDTAAQCEQYKEKTLLALPAHAKRLSFINCIEVTTK